MGKNQELTQDTIDEFWNALCENKGAPAMYFRIGGSDEMSNINSKQECYFSITFENKTLEWSPNSLTNCDWSSQWDKLKSDVCSYFELSRDAENLTFTTVATTVLIENENDIENVWEDEIEQASQKCVELKIVDGQEGDDENNDNEDEKSKMQMELMNKMQLQTEKLDESVNADKSKDLGGNDQLQMVLCRANEKWKGVDPMLQVTSQLESGKNGDKIIRKQNKPFLLGFEMATRNIMKSRWDMQTSLLVIRAVMSLNPGDKDNEIWKLIVGICQSIQDLYLKMISASLRVAGGLLLFQDALAKVEGRQGEELQIALIPLIEAMQKLKQRVDYTTEVCDEFETTVSKTKKVLDLRLPESNEAFGKLQETMKALAAEKEKYESERAKIEPKLQQLEAEFNVLLNDNVSAKMVQQWYKERQSMKEMQDGSKPSAGAVDGKADGNKDASKDDNKDDKDASKDASMGKDGNKAGNKDDSKDDRKDDRKDDNKDDNKDSKVTKLTLEDLTGDIQQKNDLINQELGQFKAECDMELKSYENGEVDKELTFEQAMIDDCEESLKRKQERSKKQEAIEESLTSKATNSQNKESSEATKSWQMAIKKIGNEKFDEKPYLDKIEEARKAASDYEKKAANASDFRQVTRTRREYRRRKSESGWWVFKSTSTWDEPIDISYTERVQTNEKSNYQAAATRAKTEAQNLTEYMEKRRKAFEKDKKARKDIAKQDMDAFKKMLEEDSNAITKQCQAMKDEIQKEIAAMQLEIETRKESLKTKREQLIARKKMELDSKKSNKEEELNKLIEINKAAIEEVIKKGEELESKRKKFDKWQQECQSEMERLREQVAKYQEMKNQYGLTEQGIIKLMSIAPYLKYEANNNRERATAMSEIATAFGELILQNSGRGLTIRGALISFSGQRWQYMADVLAQESFLYWNDIVCDSEEEFNALIKPALMQHIRKDKMYQDDTNAQLGDIMVESFRKWIEKNNNQTQRAEKSLKQSQKDLKALLPGCDTFCGTLYGKCEKVNGILEIYANKMKSIQLNLEPTNNEKSIPIIEEQE